MEEFTFKGCIEIKELLGKQAADEMKLLEMIEEVPSDSIYYHTHSYFLRHYYIAGPYPNDFANWAAIQVRDRVLGEKLAVVTPWGDKNLEDIRSELMEIIDSHLSETKNISFVVYGQPFYFMKSRIIEVPTGVTVQNLKQLRDALRLIDASAIYNHIFEARLRVRRRKSDFSIWLEDILGRKELAGNIEKIDAYMYSLEGLRQKILQLCEQELRK
ncbi:MAG: hypothetical protein GF375_04770 [Candidatus Omnitrophica bacterium]|nr:hypothetical protein [Candidatus Omnitrophota bacterium]MBD3269340.1 hypothetical protein [Candidatus Omnitrophota bacterium]